MEPLNKDTFRTSHFIRLSFFRGDYTRVLSACPLLGGLSSFRVLFIRDFTVPFFSPFRSFPRAAVRLRRRIEHQSRSETDGGMSDTTSKQPHPPRSPPPPGLIRRKKSIRPMAGRKNKEGREKAIMDHREVS